MPAWLESTTEGDLVSKLPDGWRSSTLQPGAVTSTIPHCVVRRQATPISSHRGCLLGGMRWVVTSSAPSWLP